MNCLPHQRPIGRPYEFVKGPVQYRPYDFGNRISVPAKVVKTPDGRWIAVRDDGKPRWEELMRRAPSD